MAERPVYQKRPTHLDDPSDWILILDETLRCASSSNHPGCPAGEYILTNHPGSGWGTPALKPDGTNKCTMDGAVRWIPEAEAVAAKARMLDWKRQLREQKQSDGE